MRRLFLLTVVTSAVLVLGCPKKKGTDADAAAEAEAPMAAVVDAAPMVPVVDAKNSADVARFKAETAVSDDDAKLGQVAPARNAPKTGKIVATLKPGAEVNKIAEYQDSLLVTFADPKEPNTTLMGWVGKEAFTVRVARDGIRGDGGTAPTDAGAKGDSGVVVLTDAGGLPHVKLSCPAGMAAVILTKDPICKRKCTKNSDCRVGACANASGPTGAVVRVCSSE